MKTILFGFEVGAAVGVAFVTMTFVAAVGKACMLSLARALKKGSNNEKASNSVNHYNDDLK